MKRSVSDDSHALRVAFENNQDDSILRLNLSRNISFDLRGEFVLYTTSSIRSRERNWDFHFLGKCREDSPKPSVSDSL
jgi:hypothetical protein